MIEPMSEASSPGPPARLPAETTAGSRNDLLPMAAAPSRPLRILHVYKDYPPVMGGIENHIAMLARAQAAAGHQVSVLVTSPRGPGGESTEAGVRVIRVRRWATLASTPISPALVRRLGQLEADVYHLHSPYPVAELAWLIWRRHPMVLTYHSDVVRQRLLGALWRPFLRMLLRRADRILPTNPPYVESSIELRRVRDRITIVPLGIDPARFEGVDRRSARARFGPGPKLVFVGRLRYYKGLGVLIEALTRLPEARLLVVGTGPMGETWRARAAELGLEDRIEWLGDVPDDELPQVYAAGDIFVLPAVARSEAFGIVLMEAMASGLPCVSTELGTGTSWVNQDGRTGRVVPPEDPAALAGALRELLADPEGRRAMGAAARQRVGQELSAERLVQRVMDIYAEVGA